MKKILTIAAFTLCLNCLFYAQSQNPPDTLNQARLLKQFEGNWKCEIGTDTAAFWNMEPYCSGFEASLKYITKEKIVREGKGIYGYDKETDKIIEAGIACGKDIGVYVMWFITDNKFVLMPYDNSGNTEKTSFKMEGEFKSPDILVEKTIIDDKTVNIKTWTRSSR